MNTFNAQPVEDLLQEAQGNWTGYITSHEECVEMRAKLSSARIVDIDGGENIVDDFPHSPEAKMVHAYQLWEAMVDYSDYIEAKDNKNHFQVDRLKAMSEVEMEVLAWELLVSSGKTICPIPIVLTHTSRKPPRTRTLEPSASQSLPTVLTASAPGDILGSAHSGPGLRRSRRHAA